MATLDPYLIFSGDCRDAMEFYATCLQGTLDSIQTFAESPIEVGPEENDRIFNSVVVANDFRIRASDDLAAHSVSQGTNFSLYLHFDDAKEKDRVFAALSNGGTILFPNEPNFGMLQDRYGVRWMLSH
ncbi:MAG: VOC family protein [Rhodothermales bacterium]|nr:VOC family protein [Rhodothermales bacterium]